jgi:hypothetical protein
MCSRKHANSSSKTCKDQQDSMLLAAGVHAQSKVRVWC